MVNAKITFRKKYKQEIKAYLMLALPIIWWIVFFLIPLCIALYFSFTDLKLSYQQISRLGFFQYKAVINDKKFWRALLTTGIWAAVMLVGNNFFGFLLAYLISTLKKSRKLFLALLFWPTLVSAVAGSEITKYVFGAYKNSLMNMLTGVFGAEPRAWLENENTALFSLMLMPFLFGFCVKMIIFYAAITSLPKSYLDAARLETNSGLTVIIRIILPLIKNIIILNLLLSLIDGLKVLGPMQLITKGSNNTMSSILYIYNLAFEGAGAQKGKASAAAFILFVIILAASIIQMKLSGKSGETYE